MTTLETTGKYITAGIAAWSALPAVVVLAAAATGRHVTAGGWFMSFAIPIVWAWLLYQGYSWVRILSIVGCGLGACLGAFRLVAMDATLLGRVPVLAGFVINVCLGGVLWQSAAVRAYFQRQNSAAALNLTEV